MLSHQNKATLLSTHTTKATNYWITVLHYQWPFSNTSPATCNYEYTWRKLSQWAQGTKLHWRTRLHDKQTTEARSHSQWCHPQSNRCIKSVNGKEIIPIRTTLKELGHKQDPIGICTDNTTAFGIVNSSVRQKWSRAMHMRFYWKEDRIKQGQFWVFWAPSDQNKGECFTKHFTGAHHQCKWPEHLYGNHSGNYASCALQGCVETLVIDYFDSTDLRAPEHPELALTIAKDNNSNGYLQSRPFTTN